MAGFMDHLVEQVEAMSVMFAQSDLSRTQAEKRFEKLTVAVETLAFGREGSSDEFALLQRVAEGQERLIARLEDGGVDGLDAESRMRLRSIDVQLLRVLEEMSAGRQETLADIRSDIAGLSRTIKGARGRPPEG
jgi:hypothetical protein